MIARQVKSPFITESEATRTDDPKRAALTTLSESAETTEPATDSDSTLVLVIILIILT